MRLVVLPTFLALTLASLLSPPARWLRRHRWPRAASLAVVVAFVLVLVGLGAWLGPTVGGQLGALATSLTRGLQEVEQWLINELEPSEQQISGAVDRLIQTLRGNIGNLAQSRLSAATVLLQVLAGLMLAVVVPFFFLKDGDRIGAGPRASCRAATAGVEAIAFYRDRQKTDQDQHESAPVTSRTGCRPRSDEMFYLVASAVAVAPCSSRS